MRSTDMILARKALSVEIFADGADKASVLALAANPQIKGFTTNPTLMRKAGVIDYENFAREILSCVGDRPISFEVFSDDFEEMYQQARKIATWAPNVYVKIPVTNTAGQSAVPLICALAHDRVQMNVTAIFTEAQVRSVSDALKNAPPCNISVFAGRIADAGIDPLPIMRRALEIMRPHPHQKLIWASPREVFNAVQADDIGCHIITMTPDLISKLGMLGRDLEDFSLDTVKMFRRDAVSAGYSL
jgi:transaldolase